MAASPAKPSYYYGYGGGRDRITGIKSAFQEIVGFGKPVR